MWGGPRLMTDMWVVGSSLGDNCSCYNVTALCGIPEMCLKILHPSIVTEQTYCEDIFTAVFKMVNCCQTVSSQSDRNTSKARSGD